MLNRYRVGSGQIKLQEVSGMYVAKTYLTLSELSDLIMRKLSESDQKRFAGSLFVPVKMGVKDEDLTVEFTFVATHAK